MDTSEWVKSIVKSSKSGDLNVKKVVGFFIPVHVSMKIKINK
jgi:hypothetical protein